MLRKSPVFNWLRLKESLEPHSSLCKSVEPGCRQTVGCARTAALIAESGHDVATVPQEELSGTSDARVFETCMAERRCLISLDLDFADVIRFPPYKTAGMAVLRLPQGASPRLLTALVRNLLTALETASIAGRLWVVELGRIRVHEEGELPEKR